MLKPLDKLLRQTILGGVGSALTENTIGFQPPDERWRNFVNSLNKIALNIYLVDLYENRKLRSNEQIRRFDDGVFTQEVVPPQINCHYLITAWSPAQQNTLAVEPAFDEHALLYDVAAVLFRNDPLQPSRILTPANGLNDWPLRFRDRELPVTLASAEGFTKLSEFWHSMGDGAYWKPALHIIVPLPVTLFTTVAGPGVTTLITDTLQRDRPDTDSTQISIGGHVLDTTVTPATLISRAWVQLESVSGEALQTTLSDSEGRFVFERLQPGEYQLRWRVSGRPDPLPRTIMVPSSTGEYDVKFE